MQFDEFTGQVESRPARFEWPSGRGDPRDA